MTISKKMSAAPIVYQDEHLITGTFLPMLGIDGFCLHVTEESLRGAIRRMALLRFCKLASTVGLATFCWTRH